MLFAALCVPVLMMLFLIGMGALEDLLSPPTAEPVEVTAEQSPGPEV
ncbi:hypothetical protein GCM10010347_36220 [Streptomyces cirratus]|uniref:Uncharacterized protein n=1 Tax=Streptomyces cirratus TaxID=68187 RepID=A0ABQ3EYN6_9ACTN|nr:hypothetical protein [Streptomyces cirratus]GHB63026.1 hypothetical protein GCM10010347_36220 [Streptomyces cirratus]